MKNSLRTRAWLIVLTAVTTPFVIGCQTEVDTAADSTAVSASDKDDHAHGDGHEHGDDHAAHPTDLPGALKEVEQMQAKICGAFRDGTPDNAHDELHEVGHLLEQLPALAQQKSLSEEATATVKQSVEALFDAFGSLDEVLHGGEEVDVDAVDQQITEALAQIRGATE